MRSSIQSGHSLGETMSETPIKNTVVVALVLFATVSGLGALILALLP
jgi:hypothetical protein